LIPCEEIPGSSVIVGVKKAPLKPGEKTLLTKSFMIRGKILALIHGEPRISFSEHVRENKIRARLSSLALSKLMGTGLGVHFRSSSKYASDEAVLEEIDQLLQEYRDLMERARSLSAPAKLRDGEFIGIIGVTSLAKGALDEIRRSVTRTISLHHSLKSSGLSDYVDLIEGIVASDTCSQEASSRLLHYIGEKLRERQVVNFVHIKPTGDRIILGEGEVLDVVVDSNVIQLTAKRTIKSTGAYNGLGVEKEPGDIDYVVIRSDQPILSHNYYRRGKWIGSYININTPPEIIPGLVKYHDLLVDVVVYPSGDMKVVDEDELEKAREVGLISKHLYNYAKNVLKHVLENYRRYVYNPGYES
jgi:Ribonuclease G/E